MAELNNPGGGTDPDGDVSDDFCGYGDAVTVVNALQNLIPGCFPASLVNIASYSAVTVNGQPAPPDVSQWGIESPNQVLGPDGKTVVFTAGQSIGLAKRFLLEMQSGSAGGFVLHPEPIVDSTGKVERTAYALLWAKANATAKADAIATQQQIIKVAQATLAQLEA